MSLRHHTQGSSRPWQHREPDHTLGNCRWVHGPILPMDEPGFWSRLFGGGRKL